MSEDKHVEPEGGNDKPAPQDKESPAGGDASSAAEAPQAEQEQSREELLLTLQDAQAKADEYWNQLLRVRAELENVQRRAQRELENARKFALEKFVRELLPVLDSLEMGLNAAQGEGVGMEKMVEGLDLTLKMLRDTMEKFGVRAVDPVGERFNPEHHQAMSTQPSDDVAPNTVLNVYQKGYLLNDRLIRPAMVVVSAGNGPRNKEEGAQSPTIDEMA